MKILFLPVLISLFLAAVPAARAQNEERDRLLEQRKQLTDRIETLKGEQDFLLFEKVAYSSDSKYLVLETAAGTGRIKYKNRVLRDFRFFPVSGDIHTLKRGMIILTNKIEVPRKGHALVFGRSLILAARGTDPHQERALPLLFLEKKDFDALYYAVENGAAAYVLP